MKTILLFGAGKSATVLIEYLLETARKNGWKLLLVDADKELAQSKIGTSLQGEALSFDVLDPEFLVPTIGQADIVISLLPPHLHIAVAKECIQQEKNLLTASYLSEDIKKYENEIAAKGLLFLYEMGLDPGIDHMSAMSILDRIRAEGGTVQSFISHCGGLVAPESDNNPWHYKISWNPRNVVTAGRDGASFKQNGEITHFTQQQIFEKIRLIDIDDAGEYAWYPNRDSVSYIPLYRLENISTFIRTTLRHPAYVNGWNQLLALGLCSDQPIYHANNPSLREAFLLHFAASGQEEKLKSILNKFPEFKVQLQFLGFEDNETRLTKNQFSPADLLQKCLELKLKLSPVDRDMIVMLHEIEFIRNGKRFKHTSSLCVKGANAIQTAMAKTVGLPLGIAATLVLQEKMNVRGLLAPTQPAIYKPVLAALAAEGICFKDQITEKD